MPDEIITPQPVDPEAQALNDAFQLALKVVLAYQSIHNLPPGGHADLPPIRYKHDKITVTVDRDA